MRYLLFVLGLCLLTIPAEAKPDWQIAYGKCVAAHDLGCQESPSSARYIHEDRGMYLMMTQVFRTVKKAMRICDDMAQYREADHWISHPPS